MSLYRTTIPLEYLGFIILCLEQMICVGGVKGLNKYTLWEIYAKYQLLVSHSGRFIGILKPIRNNLYQWAKSLCKVEDQLALCTLEPSRVSLVFKRHGRQFQKFARVSKVLEATKYMKNGGAKTNNEVEVNKQKGFTFQ